MTFSIHGSSDPRMKYPILTQFGPLHLGTLSKMGSMEESMIKKLDMELINFWKSTIKRHTKIGLMKRNKVSANCLL